MFLRARELSNPKLGLNTSLSSLALKTITESKHEKLTNSGNISFSPDLLYDSVHTGIALRSILPKYCIRDSF